MTLAPEGGKIVPLGTLIRQKIPWPWIVIAKSVAGSCGWTLQSKIQSSDGISFPLPQNHFLLLSLKLASTKKLNGLAI